MTYGSKLKEEISKSDENILDARNILYAYIKYNGKFNDNVITFTIENASVTRYIYKLIKEVYNIKPSVIVRNQKRFRVKQIYIISFKSSDEAYNKIDNFLTSDEEFISYLKGCFLACGFISDPGTSGYHLEFNFNSEEDSMFIKKLLSKFKINAKCIKRGNKYVTYVKSSEQISDVIRMFKAVNCLFDFEDIRIYRDHKNMVNRLNNCEIANQEKTISAGLKQTNEIIFLKEKDLFDLLDDKTKIVAEYRLKYPESSYQELAEIISLETNYNIGKSGINHHFIKIRNLIKKYNDGNSSY